MTPEERANADQMITQCSEDLPLAWGRMFKNLLKEGFTRQESLELIMNYVRALFLAAGGMGK